MALFSPRKISPPSQSFQIQILRLFNKQAVILSNDSKIKTYHEIPIKRSFLPSFMRLILNGGPGYLHEHCDKLHKELGFIYRERLGTSELVFLSDTKFIQTVIANEGHYPQHNVPVAWSFYNNVKRVERGLFFQSGEPWAKLRRAFNKVMLADVRNILRFSNDIIEINTDLLESWRQGKQYKNSILSNEILIDELKTELCKWSIESTCFMLFGRRIGAISDAFGQQPDIRAEELVNHVADMFRETSNFQILPVKFAHQLNLKTWRRFENATSNMLRIADEFTKENIHKAKEPGARNSVVGDLLRLNSLDEEEISSSIIDLIIAAADTTSNSLQWMLYLIAKHQDVQSKILDEVTPLLKGGLDSRDLFEEAPYLRAFVKEALRLYPTAPFLARTLDKDIVLGDYSIPAGKTIVFSMYTTGRMDRYFEQPQDFIPERWLRSDNNKRSGCPKRTNHAYASLPFGIGARMCIGRRAADLEMSLFIASFVKEFKSSMVEDENVTIKLNMILCPKTPIKLRLECRERSRS